MAVTRQYYLPSKYHHFPSLNNPVVLCSVRVNGNNQSPAQGRIDLPPYTGGDNGWYSIFRTSFLPADISPTYVSSFLNNWANYDAGSTYTLGSYYKDSKNIVHLEGLLKKTTAWATSTMFALPSGSYNTDYRSLFSALCAGGLARIDIDTAGNVISQDLGSATWTSIDGIQSPVGVSWTSGSYLNSWTTYDATFAPAQYHKDADGIVHLRGLVKSGTMAASIFNLPAGNRPTYYHMFPVVTYNAIGRCDIYPDGSVIPASGSNAWYSLDGIWFPATAPTKTIIPPFANEWTNFSPGSWQTAAYWRDSSGIVRMMGLLKSGALVATGVVIRDDPIYTQLEPL